MSQVVASYSDVCFSMSDLEYKVMLIEAPALTLQIDIM